jgi:hypothetical protein
MEDQRERNAGTLAALKARIQRDDKLKAHYAREIVRLEAILDEHENQWRARLNLPPRNNR